MGVSRDGVREVLGLWIADNEGDKFWLSVMNELKNLGVQDILIAVVPSRQICSANRLPGNGRPHTRRNYSAPKGTNPKLVVDSITA